MTDKNNFEFLFNLLIVFLFLPFRFPRLDVKLIGYASFAPINMPDAQPDTVYASLKDKLFNLSHQSSSSSEIDNESTTQIAATADNYLQEVDDAKTDDNDMQQRLQQKRHLKLQHVQEMMADDQETEEEMPTDNVEYNYRNHPRHYRHHSQHQHHRHQQHQHPSHENAPQEDSADIAGDVVMTEEKVTPHHKLFKRHHYSAEREEEDVLEKNIEQQQHETKLLEHIVHKLEQEEKQLLLLHQQQQEQEQ